MNRYRIEVNGKIYEVGVEKIETIASAAAPKPTAAPAPKPAAAPAPAAAPKSAPAPVSAAAAGTVTAPMPGTVLDIKVTAGQTVSPEPYC
jgi:glutaconyl-CoA decarboxylase